MEHRWNRRKYLSTDIRIYKNKVKVDSGKILDISKGGMAFKPVKLAYLDNTKLVIEFDVNIAGVHVNYRIPVLVLHSSGKKIGTMFINNDHGILHFINNLSMEPLVKSG